jgi:hypothetical protein
MTKSISQLNCPTKNKLRAPPAKQARFEVLFDMSRVLRESRIENRLSTPILNCSPDGVCLESKLLFVNQNSLKVAESVPHLGLQSGDQCIDTPCENPKLPGPKGPIPAVLGRNGGVLGILLAARAKGQRLQN